MFKKLVAALAIGALAISTVVTAVPITGSVVLADAASDKARVDAQYDLCIWNDVNRTVILGPYKGDETHVQVPGRVYVDGQYYKVYIGNDTFFKAPRATGIFTLVVGTPQEPVEYRGNDLSNAFSGLTNCQVIDLRNMLVGNVSSMSGMFQNNSSMEEVYLPQTINTSGLANVNYMFFNCASLIEVDLADIKFNGAGNPLGVFGNTANLQRITTPAGNTAKVSLDGHNFRDQATGTYYTSFPTGNSEPVTLEYSTEPGPTPGGDVKVNGFSAVQSGTNSINVKWDAMSQGVSKYLIECIGSNNTATSYEINESTGIPNSAYTIKNLVQGVTYYIRMCAYDYDGRQGPYTDYSTVIMSQNTPTPGTVVNVTGFNAYALDGNTINVTWNPVSQGVAKYTIQILGSDGYHNIIDINENGSLPNSSYIIRNLTPGISYFIQMWATNYNGEAGNSTSLITVTTPGGNNNPQPDPQPTPQPGDTNLVPSSLPRVYRLFNPSLGTHLFTTSVNETQTLVRKKWKYEGIAWTAPKSSGVAVYRLFNPKEGYHFYTTDINERRVLISKGWNYEGVCWYSGSPDSGSPVFRLFNPNAATPHAAHHFTTDSNEMSTLVSMGWRYEGVPWYTYSKDYNP